MNKEFTNNFTIRIIVFLSLFTIFWSNNLSGDYFYFACYGLILTFGIIHGANDILLLLKGKEQTNKIIISSTLKYLLIVVLISVLFFLFSEISLLFSYYLAHITLENNNGQYLEAINQNQSHFFIFFMVFSFFRCYLFSIRHMFRILFMK